MIIDTSFDILGNGYYSILHVVFDRSTGVTM